MIFRPRVRRATAGIAAAVMLFAQFAVAAHACTTFPAGVTAPGATHDASPCHDMDPQPDPVCLQHCADSPQSFDHHTVAPIVPAAAPVYTLGRCDRVAVFMQSEERHSYALLVRVTAPPLAVRNCCFRI